MAEEQQAANTQENADAPAPAPAAPEAPAPAGPTPVAREKKAAPRATNQPEQYIGLGRRKTSTARVFLRPGEGRWKVNGRTLEDYFPRPVLRQAIQHPLVITETHGSYDVLVNVDGGGQRGQAEAVRLGVSRALLKIDEDFRARLRAEELLTRDAREVERKKPGRPKARKRFQFSKR